MTIPRAAACLFAALLLLMLAACTSTPQPQPVVINEPVDAFNAVGQPYTPADGRYGTSLSGEVQRLQNARRLYQLSQEQQLQAIEHSQHVCRQQGNSRRVPIQAPGEFYFCEPQPNTATGTRK